MFLVQVVIYNMAEIAKEYRTNKLKIMKSLLLNYSQPMNKGYGHTFRYDHLAKLNVVCDEKGIEMPFVNSNLDNLCIVTKTETMREADDTANEMLLIATKTRSEMESDDAGSFIYK